MALQREAEFDPIQVLVQLADAGVEFVVIGSVAGAAHGSAYSTDDTDLAYDNRSGSVKPLAAALGCLGLAPNSASMIGRGNLTFETAFGKLDVLDDPAGAPSYEKLRAGATEILVAGRCFRIASLDHLIAMAEAMGRTKDKLLASEYRVISDLLRAPADEES